MADRKSVWTIMSQVKSWDDFKTKFPNVKIIDKVPMMFGNSVSIDKWTTGAIVIDPLNPDTPTCFVRQPRDFKQLGRDSLEVSFPFPNGMVKSFTLTATPAETPQEEALLAGFLSQPPPIHAIETPRMGRAFTEEGLESFLRSMSRKFPPQAGTVTISLYRHSGGCSCLRKVHDIY
jgi:hypothetical protein